MLVCLPNTTRFIKYYCTCNLIFKYVNILLETWVGWEYQLISRKTLRNKNPFLLRLWIKTWVDEFQVSWRTDREHLQNYTIHLYTETWQELIIINSKVYLTLGWSLKDGSRNSRAEPRNSSEGQQFYICALV